MATQLEIVNRALALNATDSIGSLTEASQPARLVNAIYSQIYATFLGSFRWSFARTNTGQLTKLAGGDTDDGYERYQKPGGTLEIYRVYTSDDMEIPFRVDGDEIITLYDVTTTDGVFVQYLGDVDEGQLSPAAATALSYLIAAEVCIPLTESQTAFQNLMTMADKHSTTAKRLDAQSSGQTALARPEEYSIIAGRGAGRYGNRWGTNGS